MRVLLLLALLGQTPPRPAWALTVFYSETRPHCVVYGERPGRAVTCTPFCVRAASRDGVFPASVLSEGDCDSVCRAKALDPTEFREVPCAVPNA